MTDEEWEQLRPLVQAYAEALNKRDIYLLETCGMSINRTSAVDYRANMDAAVRKEKLDSDIRAAKDNLRRKCFATLGVTIDV